ncbi:serine-type endopeptidase activity protein [Coemansia interrupta]|uniref:Serine-type endopeptidase activity protein n=1 Tax=Coemansia interrupta TaxID=1126814 RepID=A0A9W8LH71_9FUNG|nr:serine-type endopeptidase activity protein [Coemansia interrupta]
MNQDLSSSSVTIFKDFGAGLVMCGGTILSPRHILTAAHCIINDATVVVPPQNVSVYYNNLDRDDQVYTKVTKITAQPDYTKSQADARLDIAILEIDEISLDSTARRAPVFSEDIVDNQALLTLGWGQTEPAASNTNMLRGTVVYAGNSTLCSRFSSDWQSNNGPQICTPNILHAHSSACMGDSGTGLMINNQGVLSVAGLVSIAVNIGESECGNDTGGQLYVNAGYYLDFIASATGLSKEYLTGLTNNM